MSNKPYHSPPVYQPPAQSENGWGLTGFILSLVSLALCGLPSIIAVVVSAIGLKKQPQGFAIAGLIIGGLGVLELIAFGFFLVAVYNGVAVAKVGFKGFETRVRMHQAASEIGDQWEADGSMPDQAAGDQLVADDFDSFGNVLVYQVEEDGFSLLSWGPDGLADTEDDILSGPYTSIDSTRESDFEFDMEEFEAELEAEMKRLEPEATKDNTIVDESDDRPVKPDGESGGQ